MNAKEIKIISEISQKVSNDNWGVNIYESYTDVSYGGTVHELVPAHIFVKRLTDKPTIAIKPNKMLNTPYGVVDLYFISTLTEKDNFKLNLYDYTYKSNPYMQLSGVYHDPEYKMAVASNGYCLVACPALYDESLAGKIIAKDGSEVDGRYPKWHSVIPRETVSVDLSALTDQAVKEGEQRLKEYKVLNKKSKYADEMDYVGVDDDYGFAIPFAKIMRQIGLDGWVRSAIAKLSLHMKRIDDGTIFMFMPKQAPKD